MPDAPPLPPPPIGERGYVTQKGSWWAPEDYEETPELRWPLSVSVYDRMRRTDAQVASVLRAVTLPIRRTTWRVDPAGARDEVAELIAEDLGLPLVGGEPVVGRTRDRFSWAEHLRLALLELPFGFMFFEQVVRIDEAGRVRLRKLGARMPRTITHVEVAADGGLQWIEQAEGAGKVKIPVDRLVAYVHDREGGNWLGSSLLRPAYKHWILKDRLLRTQAQTIERNGMGVPRYTGADGETSLQAGLDQAKAWRSGASAAAAIPFGAELDLVGVTGTLPDADPVIRYHDEQIARAVLAHFLNLGTETGSWALGSTFADFFTSSLQAVGKSIADVSNQHVVEDLVDWNFGPDEPCPRIVFDEIGTRDALTALAVGGPAAKQAVDSLGALVRAGFDPKAAAEALGLPPIEHTGLVPVTVQGENVAEGGTT
jgi:hypothetical protein